MSQVTCELCNKTIHKNGLKRHQQSNNCINVNSKSEYKCKYCEKTFNRNDKKNEHEINMSCCAKDIYQKMQIESVKKDSIITQKEREIELKDKEIDELKEQNKYMLDKISVTTNSNNTYNNCNFVYVNINCPDDILTAMPYFTMQHKMAGGNGIARFLMEFVLKNKVFVNDYSRKLISYMLNDKIIKDNGEILAMHTLDPINKEYSKDRYNIRKVFNEMQKEKMDKDLMAIDLILKKYTGYEKEEVFKDLISTIVKEAYKEKMVDNEET